MDETTRKALTTQYLQASEQAWSTLRAGDAEHGLVAANREMMVRFEK